MGRRKRRWICFVAGAVVLIGAFGACNDKVAQHRQDAATAEPSATAVDSSAAPSPDRLGGRKRANKGDAPVYVDGELRAFLKYGELPNAFEPVVVDRRGDMTLCNVAQYLAALGVDLAKVKALHLEGSGRTAAIDGDELRRHEKDLHFTFAKLRGTMGKAMMDWPNVKVKSTTRIDKVSAMHVFENKPAPTWDPKGHVFRWADGKEVDGIPYVGEREPVKAPRIYVDGKLLGLFDDIDNLPESVWKTGDGRGTGKTTDVVTEDDEPDEIEPAKKGGGGGGRKILLARYLAHRGVDVDAIVAVEVIGEDRVLARFDQAHWTKSAETLRFGVPRRRGSKLRLELEEPATPYPGPVNAQAIAVYVASKASDREIAQPRRRPRRK